MLTKIAAQVVKIIEGVDQGALDSMTQSLRKVFGETFKTDFKYEGIVAPSKLESVVAEIHKTIDALKANIAKAKELSESTKVTAEAAVKAHQNAESIPATMKANVEEMRNDLLFKGHFVCDMLDDAVIEDFYHRDLRPAVTTPPAPPRSEEGRKLLLPSQGRGQGG